MRPITNPLARVFLHVGMWAIVIYSTIPFIWTLINSIKTKRDANASPPKWIFEPTLESYQTILIESLPENGALIGYGLLAIFVVLLLLSLFARRFPIMNWVIVGIIAIVLFSIPRFVDTAEIYDYFLNTIIICLGTVIISVSIGALA
ncbi:MAG: hypothetical protein KAS38_21965, partial [Anaerolineales bacterium]|nr:hypothetical protein [Anaerolineales bacterium]